MTNLGSWSLSISSSCRMPQSSSLPGKKGSSSTSSSSSSLSRRARTSSPLCCCVLVLYKIICKFHILLSWPLPSFQRTHQEGKGEMKLHCCRIVVCRPSVSSLKQLAPSKFAPSKGGRVVKWLLLPRNFTRLALRKSLLSAM